MEINSVTPRTVNYSLRINDGAIQDVPYRAVEVHPKGVFGAAIRIDLLFDFCIGRDYRYSLSQFIGPDGLQDKVGNPISADAFENNDRIQNYRFRLEYGHSGHLLVIDEVSGKKTQARYEGGFFYLPLLTPIAGNQK